MPVQQKTLVELGRRVRGTSKVIRGRRVWLDEDLAAVYGVSVAHLRQCLRRNENRFPGDFAFRFNARELRCLKQLGIRSVWAFTEDGSLMLSHILKSPIAIEVSVRFVRALIEGQLGRAFAFLARAVEKAN